MVRSIPPRTACSVDRERSKHKNFKISKGLGFSISRSFESERQSPQKISSTFSGKAYKKPRKWQYITKPFFKRIKEPIVDVFKKAEEVKIIIDCGNFRKGELSFGLKSRNYIIFGKHEDCDFKEEIPLPYDVDVKKIKEIFRNDILELVLPKKKIQRKRSG